MTQQEYKMEQAIKLWNAGAILLFIVLVTLSYQYIQAHYLMPRRIFGMDIILLSLATLRIIHLITYDNITRCLREIFLDVETVKQVEGGVETYERVPSKNAFKQTMYKLLNCPWCTGVWVAWLVVMLYLLVPEARFLFFILVIAAIASYLQVISNLIGWKAEYAKGKVERLKG
jgi:hypothetical protein